MLDSPNSSPAYSPDASMSLLYKYVNNAWRQSYFNESSICRSQLKKHVPVGMIDWNIECPKCTSKTALISITGGEVDELVSPALTQLDSITPRPKNITKIANAKKKETEAEVGLFMQYINPMFYIRQISSFVTFFTPLFSSTNITTLGENESEINVTDNIDICIDNCSSKEECVDGNEMDSEHSLNTQRDNFIATPHPLGSWATVTYEKWQEDMTPFVTPQHLSIRTSQILNVGFPVDHKAIVWCYEVVDSVTSVLKLISLSSSSSSSSSLSHDIESHFKSYISKNKKQYHGVTKREKNPTDDIDDTLYAGVIDPVIDLVRRNASLSSWMSAAIMDRMHIISSLNFNPLYAIATQYYTSHIGSILIAYVSICCLALAVPSLRDITGHTLSSLRSAVKGRQEYLLSSLTDANVHNLATLMGMDVLTPIISSFHEISYITSDTSSFSLWNIYSCGAVLLSLPVFGKIIYDYYYTSPAVMLSSYGKLLEFFMSFGIALTIRYCLVMYINFLRWMISSCLSIVITIARWTIWCRPIRRFFEGIFSKPLSTIRRSVTSRNVFFTYITIVVCMFSYMLMYKSSYTTKSKISIDDSFYFAIIAVYIAFWLAVISIVFVIIFPPMSMTEKSEDINQQIAKARVDGDINLVKELKRRKSQIDSKPKVDIKEDIEYNRMHCHRINSLILLYLPALLYTLSTFMFAQSMISDDGSVYASTSTLLSKFGPDMITYAVCLLVISLHLLVARSEFKLQIPIQWLEELCGPDSLAFPLQVSSSKDDDIGKCVHEEGGRYAIYAEVDENDLTKICDGVHMGTSYIVVSCKCSSDRSLKFIQQWCSFCRCPVCGDNKDLLAKNVDDTAWKNRQDRYRKLSHLIPGIVGHDNNTSFNASAGLVLGLYALAFFNMHYTYQHMYRLVYSTAMVAALNLFCMWFS